MSARAEHDVAVGDKRSGVGGPPVEIKGAYSGMNGSAVGYCGIDIVGATGLIEITCVVDDTTAIGV